MGYEQIYNNPIPFVIIFNGILILIILSVALFFEYAITDRSIKGRILSFFKSLKGFNTVCCSLVAVIVSVMGMGIYFTLFNFDSEAAERNIHKKEGFEVESVYMSDACDLIEESYLNQIDCTPNQIFKKKNEETIDESNVLNGYTQKYLIISFDEKNEPHIKTELNLNLGKVN